MAISITLLNNGSTTSTAPALTGSVAFQNDTFYILCNCTAGAGSDITGVTGGGITWAEEVTTAASSESVSVYRGMTASGASTGQLSMTGVGTISRVNWMLVSVSGSAATAGNNGSDGIVQDNFQPRTASQTSSSVTLSAFANANNAVLSYVYVHLTGETITKEGPQTSLLVDTGSGISSMGAWAIGQDTAVTSTWTNAGGVVAAALEIATQSVATTRKLRVVTSPQRW